MSSLQVSSSISASLFNSQSVSYSQQSSKQSNSDGTNSMRMTSSQRTMLQAQMESEVSLETKNGSAVSISTEASLSLQFSERTQLAVDQQSKSPLSGSKQLPSNPIDQFLQAPSKDAEVEDGSLFEQESLTQQIYEDNMKLFDDFIKNNGGEITKENVKKFVDMMKKTIPEGFRQARDRLDGLGWMNDKDDQTLGETKQSVMDKLENFKKTMFEKIENGDVSSPEDIKFSELPGVEGSGNGFSVAMRASISVELIQVTRGQISRDSDGSASPGDTPNESTNTPSNPSLNVGSLTDSIVEKTTDLMNNYLGGEDGSISRRQANEFFDIVNVSLPEGFRQAEAELSAPDQPAEETTDKLTPVESNVLKRLNDYRQRLLESLESADTPEPNDKTGQAKNASADTDNPGEADEGHENAEVAPADRSREDDDRESEEVDAGDRDGSTRPAPFYSEEGEFDGRIPGPFGPPENRSGDDDPRSDEEQSNRTPVKQAAERARDRASKHSVLV